MPAMLRKAYACDETARAAIQAALDELIRQAHAENKRSGRGYAGAKRVLKMSHTRRARSYELFGSRTPTFAAAGDPAVARALIERRRSFLRAYRHAWGAWKAGERAVAFPYGTWKMRFYHAAPCQPPP